MPLNGKTSPIKSNTLNGDPAILLVAYGDDPLRHLASLLIDRHRDQLPDLTRPVVLFPHTSAVPRFRQILREQAAQHGYQALLPPYTGTLASWAARYASENKRLLSSTAREILLLDLLNRFPAWQQRYGVWPLIDSLFTLFDELTLQQCRLPKDPAGFIRHIADSYGADADELSPFDGEARLVHALWGAWHEHLRKNNLQDQTLQVTEGLARSLDQSPPDTPIYVAGFADFSRAEIRWLEALHARHQLTLLLQGQDTADSNDPENLFARLPPDLKATATTSPPHDDYAQFLDRAYSPTEGNLMERARRQNAASPASPARKRLTVHEAADAESEARAIDLQVRRWLIQGYRDIGIVTNDRKLARRVRALLERANVGLQDAGGWALSTTSAATALVRWLECLEQQFAYQPLLDLLKSPFLHLGLGRTELDRLVPPFEQAVVRGRNIASGLDNYRFGLDRVKADLQQHFGVEIVGGIAQLLDRLENVSVSLTALRHGRPQPVVKYLEALQESLAHLGLATGFESDEAGRELLAVLDEMRVAATNGGLRLSWSEFHQWLRRNMEQRRFRPPMKGRGVELMGLAESRLYRYDALIIAGATREHLPGQIGVPPYFNDNVRIELGLPSLARRYALLFQDFRRLLEAAAHVVISLRSEHEGERLVPSPWVERLRAFHELAYHEALNDPELEWLAQQADTVIVSHDAPLPQPAQQPAATLPPAMVPSLITATDHQRLMDCPYQFYCACGLKLAPEKDVREDIEKADFGSHVHRILEAFHTGVSGLPGPWRKPLSDATRLEAETLLREISQAVFASDLGRRFLARGWLYRWEECIPSYLEWEQKHSDRWQIQATELKKQREYREGDVRVTLAGRIDRLDRGAEGYRIVDYKTGAVPSHQEVLQGEKIQLPFYALLLEEENIAQALFLSLQGGAASEKNALEGETLALLRAAVRDRLMLLKRRLDETAPLPAWGDVDTCEICAMEGLCRREMWVAPKPAVI